MIAAELVHQIGDTDGAGEAHQVRRKPCLPVQWPLRLPECRETRPKPPRFDHGARIAGFSEHGLHLPRRVGTISQLRPQHLRGDIVRFGDRLDREVFGKAAIVTWRSDHQRNFDG